MVRISYQERRIDRKMNQLFGKAEEDMRSGRRRREKKWEDTRGATEAESSFDY